MTLTKYKSKRNFNGKNKTTEPEGKIKSSGKNVSPERKSKEGSAVGNPGVLRFVVHDHHASHHHYDLRLEINGTLKSWAVPKEPPTEKNIKRLAIQVEDHPLEYAKFKGTIPEGHYGAGTVKIWDNGTYELIKKTEKEIEIIFYGKKLKGKYVLIKTHYGSKPEKSWLFFKL